MTKYRTTLFSALISSVASASAITAVPEWRVAMSASSSTVSLPQLPPGAYSISPLPGELSDSPSATLGFNLTRPDGRTGLWQELGGALLPLAELNLVGAVGPGRVGPESQHVFRLLGDIDSNAQDQRVFGARAGEAVQTLENVSWGVWAANSSGNLEIARAYTDGALGPGIGADWVFRTDFDFVDSVNFAHLHALPNGKVLFDTTVRAPAEPNSFRQALVRYTPGLGNAPCALVQSSAAALAPGVLVGDYFASLRRAASSPRGEIYAAGGLATQTPSITTRRGIWEFCSGAPQIKALSQSTGVLGPNIPGSSAAIFNELLPIIAPTTPGSFYFSGEGSNPAFKGIFHHSNGQNRPVLINDVQGVLGPGIAGFTFDQVIDFHPLSAGRFGVVYAFIRNPATGTERTGLWRLRPDATAEPILIVGDAGVYAPAPGRLWEGVSAFNVLENGVVLAIASTSTPPSTLRRLGVWRFRTGRAPEEILKAGDLVRYPTATGVQMRAVRGVSDNFVGSASAGLQNYAGEDSWVSASGSVLVEVELEGMEGLIYPTRYVRAQVSDLSVLLEDGFE